jgi:hypothetical protein
MAERSRNTMAGRVGEAAQLEAESVDCKVREDAVRACDSQRVSRKARILMRNGHRTMRTSFGWLRAIWDTTARSSSSVADAHGVSPAHDIKRPRHWANIFLVNRVFSHGVFLINQANERTIRTSHRANFFIGYWSFFPRGFSH